MRRTALLAVPLALAVAGGYFVGTVHSPGSAVGAPPATRASGAASGTDAPTSGIIVSGLGKVSGTPDVLRLQLGVEVRRSDVSTALRDANAAQNRVRAAVLRDGVDAKDLQTEQVSVYPAFTGNGVPNGYTVSEALIVKLRDLAQAGKTIGDAVQAGGNAVRLQGLTFALEDNTALLDKARQAAYGDARTKAERYAQLAGRALGPVELVSEQPVDSQPIPYAMKLGASSGAAAAPPVPIDVGQAQVSVSVTVRWALR